MSARPPRLLAISDRRRLAGETLVDWCVRLGSEGVEAVQLREKDLPDLEIYELARQIRRRIPPEMLLLVNGRADIAKAAGADGVHLPARGLPVEALRRQWSSDLLISRSTHTLEEVEAARDEGADFVLFGPVYATPSKVEYGPPAGLEALSRAVESGPPLLALGGVTIERLKEVAATGAFGFAGIRAFHDRRHLPRLVAAARECFAGP